MSSQTRPNIASYSPSYHRNAQQCRLLFSAGWLNVSNTCCRWGHVQPPHFACVVYRLGTPIPWISRPNSGTIIPPPHQTLSSSLASLDCRHRCSFNISFFSSTRNFNKVEIHTAYVAELYVVMLVQSHTILKTGAELQFSKVPTWLYSPSVWISFGSFLWDFESLTKV